MESFILALFKVASDGKTLIFSPINHLPSNDSISVKLNSGLMTTAGKHIPELDYHFYTSSDNSSEISEEEFLLENGLQRNSIDMKIQGEKALPSYYAAHYQTPSDGKIFL